MLPVQLFRGKACKDDKESKKSDEDNIEQLSDKHDPTEPVRVSSAREGKCKMPWSSFYLNPPCKQVTVFFCYSNVVSVSIKIL